MNIIMHTIMYYHKVRYSGSRLTWKCGINIRSAYHDCLLWVDTCSVDLFTVYLIKVTNCACIHSLYSVTFTLTTWLIQNFT